MKSASTCIEPGNYFVHMADKYAPRPSPIALGTLMAGEPQALSPLSTYTSTRSLSTTPTSLLTLEASSTKPTSPVFARSVSSSLAVFEKPYNTEWKYTDVPQTGIAWTSSSFDASSWSTANGGSIPPHTATTRYYRAQVSYTGETSTLNTIGVSLVLDSAFIIYADGEETIRYDLPRYAVSLGLHP